MVSNDIFAAVKSELEEGSLAMAMYRLEHFLEPGPLRRKVRMESKYHRELVLQLANGTASMEEALATKAAIRMRLWDLLAEVELQLGTNSTNPEGKLGDREADSEERRCRCFWYWFFIGTLGCFLVASCVVYQLRDRIWPTSFSLTILVHGENGHGHLALQNKGEVIIDYGTARFHEPINGDGEATFKEIPGFYHGRLAEVYLKHASPYEAVNQDTNYAIRKGEAIYLEVELRGSDSVSGQVWDSETELLLDSVRVSYKSHQTYTNRYGEFVLQLPGQEEEKKMVRLHFFKEGYQSICIDSIVPYLKIPVEPKLRRLD